MKTKTRVSKNPLRTSLAAIAVGGLLAVPAVAFGATNQLLDGPMWNYPQQSASNSPQLTRAQVLGQLLQAKRRGNYVIDAETGQTAYQADPSAFPAHPRRPGKTRAQVLQALKKAERTGNYVIDAATGQKADQTLVVG